MWGDSDGPRVVDVAADGEGTAAEDDAGTRDLDVGDGRQRHARLRHLNDPLPCSAARQQDEERTLLSSPSTTARRASCQSCSRPALSTAPMLDDVTESAAPVTCT